LVFCRDEPNEQNLEHGLKNYRIRRHTIDRFQPWSWPASDSTNRNSYRPRFDPAATHRVRHIRPATFKGAAGGELARMAADVIQSKQAS